MFILHNDNETELTCDEIKRLDKVAYRPEKGENTLVTWFNINGVIFERSFAYTDCVLAKNDFESLKTLALSFEKELKLLNEECDV
jgi:hypothetical protein